MNSIIGCAQNAFNNLCELKINNLELIKEISDNVLANEKVILEENRKDIEIKKGFELDFKFIKLLLNNLLNNKTLYKKKFLDKAKKEIIEYDNLGVLETFFDGNTYIFLEMAIKTLISNNAMIFISQKNYMKHTKLKFFRKSAEQVKRDFTDALLGVGHPEKKRGQEGRAAGAGPYTVPGWQQRSLPAGRRDVGRNRRRCAFQGQGLRHPPGPAAPGR